MNAKIEELREKGMHYLAEFIIRKIKKKNEIKNILEEVDNLFQNDYEINIIIENFSPQHIQKIKDLTIKKFNDNIKQL